MSANKCDAESMCVPLEMHIVPSEKAGFVKWEKVVNKRVQLCGVAYKKTAKATPFLIRVCPWCGEHPGLEFPTNNEGEKT